MRGEFVDIGGQRLYYYAAGTRGAGVPVILLHGFPTSSRLWHAVVRDFPLGHRLVVVDLLGYGRSDPPTGRTPVSCAGHADAVRRLMAILGIERAAVVGHGLGGGVAQALAVREPGCVSHLVLVNSCGFGMRPRRMARLARVLGPLARHVPPALLAGLVHGSVLRGFAVPERSQLSLETSLRHFLSPTGRDALAAHLAMMRRCDTAEWSERLGTLRIPAAVVWGMHDPFFPASLGQRLGAAIPGATWHPIPGAAHFVPEDSPDALVRIIAEVLARGSGVANEARNQA